MNEGKEERRPGVCDKVYGSEVNCMQGQQARPASLRSGEEFSSPQNFNHSIIMTV